MALKILNWNVWFDNADLDGVVDFIASVDADIVCLQEVSAELLEKLSLLPVFVIAKAHDCYHEKDGCRMSSYLVILSKLNVRRMKAIPFKRQMRRVSIAWFLGWLLGYEECVEYQYADIAVRGGMFSKHEIALRIFNLHLESVAGPKRRLRSFTTVLRSLSQKGKNIVCGDLNILDKWYSSLWRALVGDSWDECWLREYERFERMFEEHGFANLFSGETTHEWSGGQLDYILVPNEMEARHTLFDDTHGSDHKPMLIELCYKSSRR